MPAKFSNRRVPRGVAATIPVIGAIARGPNNTLWVRRSTGPGFPELVDVFGGDAEYIGTLAHGTPFPIAVIRDQIAAIVTDGTDVDRLAVFKITGIEAFQ